MPILLKELEGIVGKTVFSKGKDYFIQGKVSGVARSEDSFTAVVEGVVSYQVSCMINDESIERYFCSCPYWCEKSKVCKHLVALICYILQDQDIHPEILKGWKITKNKNTGNAESSEKPKSKRKTKFDVFLEILETVNLDELKAFITSEAKCDRVLRDDLIASFSYKLSGQKEGVAESSKKVTKATFARTLREIFRAAKGRYGFIEWDRTSTVGMTILHFISSIEKEIAGAQFDNALLMSEAALEEVTKALEFADDSNGDIGMCIDAALICFRQIANLDLHEKTRKNFFDYTIMAFDKNIYQGWPWHVEMLSFASLLVRNDDEFNLVIQKVEVEEKSSMISPSEEKILIGHNLISRYKSAGEADAFITKYIHLAEIRKIFVARAIEQKDFEQAKKHIAAAEELAKNTDLSHRTVPSKYWKDYLLEIAELEQDKDTIITYAKNLYIASYDSTKYFLMLKKHVPKEEWKPLLENLIANLIKEGDINWKKLMDIYTIEEDWKSLLSLLQKNLESEEPTFHMDRSYLTTIDQYYPHLYDKYPDELASLYVKELFPFIKNGTGKKHYDTCCQYIRRIDSLSSHEDFETTVDTLRITFSKKPSFIIALNEAGY